MWIIPHSPQLLRGLGTTRAESPYSSFMMNNRTTCWGLSRLPSLTSFSGLWKCFTIPLMASPTPSWIWPVFNSGWEEKGKQRCCETIQAHRKEKIPIHLILSFLSHAFDILAVKVLKTRLQKNKSGEHCSSMWRKQLNLNVFPQNRISQCHHYLGLMLMHLSNLLGLLFGEMVTNLLIIPGDCCIGGVRHILSSFSVLGVISSPTRILSRLPSSTPFPNHRPHGNLHGKRTLFICFQSHVVNTHNIAASKCRSKRHAHL